MTKTFERGWVDDWEGRRGILKISGTEAFFFVRAYNMIPDEESKKVKVGEKVAFEWIHEGNRMIATRCIRLEHLKLPNEWAAQEWPPNVNGLKPIERLGKGRNGEVWRATTESGDVVAVKFLHRATDVSYHRFRSEIDVMTQLDGVKGVLPILAFNLPDHPSLEMPAWLSMPLAEPLVRRLVGSSLEDLVSAFATIAETLSELAARRISHRDVKPDNLFWFDGAAAIGDFGLTDFPGKETVTTSLDKLGPTFYLAPEMLNEPQTSDGGPADVYSLAKSLWVMGTGQRFPIPGEHRDSLFQTRLSTYVANRRARHLDRLISECTRFVPARRPTMSQVAEVLRNWMQGRAPLHLARPRSCSANELAKVGVQVIDAERIVLGCSRCGQFWSPMIKTGGKLPRAYWVCPNRCNTD